MAEVVRITRRLDSDVVHMPEVRALIGCDVEIVVRAVGEPVPKRNWDSLKGSVLRYDDPFEPIDVEDWEALQ